MKVQWDEPVAFARDVVEASGAAPTLRGRILAAIATSVVVDALILGFEGFFHVLHQKDLGVPGYTYFVAPTLAGTFVYFLPAMLIAARSTIVLTEKGVHRNKAVGTELHVQLWPWDSISELAVEDVRIGNGVHRVLVVRSSLEPNDILLGLGDAPLDRIQSAISEMGKTLIHRAGVASRDESVS